MIVTKEGDHSGNMVELLAYLFREQTTRNELAIANLRANTDQSERERIMADNYRRWLDSAIHYRAAGDSSKPENRAEDFSNTLENGVSVLCEAMGVSTERYDTDQADIECYMDCFREAAELVRRAGFVWDVDAGEFNPAGDADASLVSKLLDSPLDLETIQNVFCNLIPIDHDQYKMFRVLDSNGSDAGNINYMGRNEWRVEVDNFPSSKKYFAWNLPMQTVRDFANDIARTGLDLKIL